MSVPLDLQEAITSYISKDSLKNLKKAFADLSFSYRHDCLSKQGVTKKEVDAYLLGRLPETYCVLSSVFKRLEDLLPKNFSCVDFGSGPASALFALKSIFGSSSISYLGIEEKQPMIDAARFLSNHLGYDASFIQQLAEKPIDQTFDIAIASYLLNELKNIEVFFDEITKCASTIVIVEPGTPSGFSRILAFRDIALNKGYEIVSPCPHHQKCPTSPPKWCHFSKRLERPSFTREIKGGDLGYEDEKYAYLIVSKIYHKNHESVVVDHPKLFNFKVQMNVCHQDGKIHELDFMKKDKESYKKAKKTSWGDFL